MWEIAPDDRKGDVVVSYFVVVYIATALPAVGVGARSASPAWPACSSSYAPGPATARRRTDAGYRRRASTVLPCVVPAGDAVAGTSDTRPYFS